MSLMGEPLPLLTVSGELLWEKLNRDEAVEIEVFTLVDDAHATLAEFFEDFIM